MRSSNLRLHTECHLRCNATEYATVIIHKVASTAATACQYQTLLEIYHDTPTFTTSARRLPKSILTRAREATNTVCAHGVLGTIVRV